MVGRRNLDFGVAGPVARHLGASCVLEDAVWLRITERPIATDVVQVIATEFVVDGNVENQVAVTAKVDVFEDQVPPPPLVAALLHGGDVAPFGGDPGLPADGLNRVEDGLVGGFSAAGVLLASMDVVAIRVDKVAATGANTFDALKLLKRRDRLAEKLAEPRLPLLLLDRLVGEAGHVGCPCVLQPALLGLRAVGILLVRHVMLQDGVARLAVIRARDGDASVRAVERAQVLAPCAGRLFFG